MAIVFASVGVVATAAIGHPASSSPLVSIPFTIAHLGAVSVWLGGVLSLLFVRRAAPAEFQAHAFLVSRTSLTAFIIVAITGAFQSAVLLAAPSDLISSVYGRPILLKIAGLMILGVFGWHHRSRAVPALDASVSGATTVSLRYETAIMILVIVVAAFLSYTSLPR
jgi:putative copper resistance protein D